MGIIKKRPELEILKSFLPILQITGSKLYYLASGTKRPTELLIRYSKTEEAFKFIKFVGDKERDSEYCTETEIVDRVKRYSCQAIIICNSKHNHSSATLTIYEKNQ